MKKTTLVHLCLLLIPLPALGQRIDLNTVVSSDDPAIHAQNVQKLDLKDIQLSASENRLAEIRKTFGEYKLLRDQHYLGKEGIIPSVETWYKNGTEWLKEWHTIRVEIEAIILDQAYMEGSSTLFSNFSTPDHAQFRSYVRGKLEDQSKELAALLHNFTRISQKIDFISNEASKLRQYPNTFMQYYPEYNTVFTPFTQAITDLSLAVNETNSKMSQSFIDKLKTVHSSSKDGIMAKLNERLLVITIQDMQDTVDSVNAMFAAEGEIYSRYFVMQEKYFSMQKALAASQVYTASRLLGEIQQLENDNSTFLISSTTIPAEERVYASSLYNAIESNAQNLYNNKPFSESFYLYTLYNQTAQKVGSLCSNEQLRSQFNCYLYNSISGHTRSSIDAIVQKGQEDLYKDVPAYFEQLVINVNKSASIN